MATFIADTVQTNFTVDTSGIRSGFIAIENIASKSSVKSAKNYNAGFLGNLKARKLGNQMRIEIRSGLDPQKLGKESADKFTGSFGKNAKGFLGKINFGAVGFGLDIATLAFGAIKSSIEKARLEEEAFKNTLNELNGSMINTNNFMTESTRLTNLLGDSSISSAQKLALLSGEFIALEDRISLVAHKELIENLGESNAPIKKAQDELEKLKQAEKTARRACLLQSGIKFP